MGGNGNLEGESYEIFCLVGGNENLAGMVGCLISLAKQGIGTKSQIPMPHPTTKLPPLNSPSPSQLLPNRPSLKDICLVYASTGKNVVP